MFLNNLGEEKIRYSAARTNFGEEKIFENFLVGSGAIYRFFGVKPDFFGVVPPKNSPEKGHIVFHLL